MDIRLEQVVGLYESIHVVHCDACGKDTIIKDRISSDDNWECDFRPHEP